MAFQAFNFGKRIGLVGAGNNSASTTSGPTNSSVPFKVTPAQAASLSVPDNFAGGLNPDQFPPVVGRLQVYRDPCNEGERGYLREVNYSPDPDSPDNPLDPNILTTFRFGCEPYASSPEGGAGLSGLGVRYSSGGGSGSSGVSNEDLEKEWRKYYAGDEPQDEWHWQMCEPHGVKHDGTYGVVPEPCCDKSMRDAIRRTMKQIFNDLDIKSRFPDIYDCMKAALPTITIHCYENLIHKLTWPPELVKEFRALRYLKFKNLSEVTLDYILQAILFLCPTNVLNDDQGLIGQNLTLRILLNIKPSCEELSTYMQIHPKDIGFVWDRFFYFDLKTGYIYRLTADGKPGSRIADWWPCKVIKGKWECCPQ